MTALCDCVQVTEVELLGGDPPYEGMTLEMSGQYFGGVEGGSTLRWWRSASVAAAPCSLWVPSRVLLRAGRAPTASWQPSMPQTTACRTAWGATMWGTGSRASGCHGAPRASWGRL